MGIVGHFFCYIPASFLFLPVAFCFSPLYPSSIFHPPFSISISIHHQLPHQQEAHAHNSQQTTSKQ
ncbi:uncharacterized protein BDW43DRAFT_275407 [Aspergillus alliaceus]|uniref:uncharacterized protein n=1 Tax=Petromyces alliaceus TaxID=209559 RepID=UPI0012A402CA|nr:uncharacterized protein BDW43DRAFT_275407 [Aspergillus alliaceus]KAB8233890.1 hypothetical protein BDW43DRAFT_275407 [Aspergillus alliaceus]